MRQVVISSPLATQSGYGHHAREFVTNALELMGNAELGDDAWDIKLVSMPWGGTPMTYPLPPAMQQRLIGLPLQQKPEVWVQITVPNEFQPVGAYNIGVTAGTEGDICPTEWIECINRMNVVVVPSEFTKKVFEDTAEKNGLTITCKLHVISEYYREVVYSTETPSAQNATKIIPALNDIPESQAFLAVGHWLSGQMGEDRKNLSGLIYAFLDTYKNKKNAPALVLKSSGATYSVTDRFSIQQRINQIQDLFPTKRLPNVYLLHGDLSDDEMNALYNHPKIKAMVSFTKAEGFGRPLLEFTTTGKPIIAPHYSGQADFLNKEFICALPGQLTDIHPSAQNQFLIAGAKWFTVDYKYAGKMMQEVLKNYKKWIGLAKRQRYHVSQNFTKTAVQQQYDALFNQVIHKDLEAVPKQVQLKLPKLDLPKLQKVGE
jgi:glycosyltransferase involved in cell wall biosynthesis